MTPELGFDPGKDRIVKKDQKGKKERPKVDGKDPGPRSETKEPEHKIDQNGGGQGNWESARHS